MTESVLNLKAPEQLLSLIESPSVLNTTLDTPSNVLVLPLPNSLVSKIETSQIIAVLASAQGPAGPPATSSGDPMASEKRIDFIGDTVIYKGEAVPGTANSASFWQISKTEFIGDDITVSWADGNADFNKVWDQRANYSYPTL